MSLQYRVDAPDEGLGGTYSIPQVIHEGGTEQLPERVLHPLVIVQGKFLLNGL